MPSKSKAKGNRFERWFVKWLQARGYIAERAWGSDGRSKGWHESVDVFAFSNLQENTCQLKSRAKLPKYLQIPEGCDTVVFKQDRGPTLVLQRAEDVFPVVPDA